MMANGKIIILKWNDLNLRDGILHFHTNL